MRLLNLYYRFIYNGIEWTRLFYDKICNLDKQIRKETHSKVKVSFSLPYLEANKLIKSQVNKLLELQFDCSIGLIGSSYLVRLMFDLFYVCALQRANKCLLSEWGKQ